MDFVNVDEKSRRWISEFASKSYSRPIKLETIDASRYSALLFPSCPGALSDLAKNDTVMHIIRNFAKEKSELLCF